MTRVLVSGGTGFVGRFIVEHLIEHGYDVVIGGRTRAAPDFFSKPVDFAPMSLDPDIDASAAFEAIDSFVHAAFQHVAGRYRGGEGNDPEGFRRANLDGSLHLFRTARDRGVRRCVFLSSRAVYGASAPGAELAEDMLCQPENLYGELKLKAEGALGALSADAFRTISLRVTGVYGAAGVGATHKWQQLFSDYLEGRGVAPRAGTEVHGDDVAAAVRLALETDHRHLHPPVLNVSDLLVDNRTILAIVRDVTGCANALPEPAALADFNAMNTERIRALGWKPGGAARLRQTIENLLA
ncbi:MAG TPA: NAD(P)-dependent oxidoreductase [Ensifer sp.]|jgi:nucleoside-diphosphate-sugar epimerase|uniref:NAD-dependent epimerase/dehydratase family protein n=1 Tax=Ensifer sp. TaxID=1872086 RepID=UPI002E13AD9B|nr:NAD(P)-dependent oxidoreductase [Ensifer sp.]